MMRENGPCDICRGRRRKVSKSKWLEFKRTWIKGEVMAESILLTKPSFSWLVVLY